MRTFENKRLFKLKLKRQSPNIDVINVEYENFENSVKQFEKYFLGTKDFLGGNDLNIGGKIFFELFEMAKIKAKMNASKVSLRVVSGQM